MAIPGTLCVALLIGSFLLAASNNGVIALSGAECFATGALLSAIDPVATIGVFGSIGVPKRLSVLVTGAYSKIENNENCVHYISEGAAREWSTVVIVIVIFINCLLS